MQSKATTVAEYLKALPDDRRKDIETVRKVILKSIPKGYEEGMQYGMIGYYVPHSLYPKGYHCDTKQPLPFLGLASQKNYMSLYLMCTWGNEGKKKDFIAKYAKTGKKLDMGSSCVKFKKAEDLALPVIAELISSIPVKEFITAYESIVKRK